MHSKAVTIIISSLALSVACFGRGRGGAGNEAGESYSIPSKAEPAYWYATVDFPGTESWNHGVTTATIKGPTNAATLAAQGGIYEGIEQQENTYSYGQSYENVKFAKDGDYVITYRVHDPFQQGYGEEPLLMVTLANQQRGDASSDKIEGWKEGEPIVQVDFDYTELGNDATNIDVTAPLFIMDAYLESQKAVNSKATLFQDTIAPKLEAIPSPGSLEEDKIVTVLLETLVINYNDVIDENGDIQPFTVSLESDSVAFAEWEWIERPAGSGTLSGQTIDFDASTKGGLYKVKLTISGWDGTAEFEGRIWLPVAGPSIDQGFSDHMEDWADWGAEYRQVLPNRLTDDLNGMIPYIKAFMIATEYTFVSDYEAKLIARAALDMRELGFRLDFHCDAIGEHTPSGYPESLPPAREPRATLGGNVIDWAKRNNVLYAFIAKQMGLPDSVTKLGPNLPGIVEAANSTPDDIYTINAYQVGIELFNGDSISDVMESLGREILHPNLSAFKEWPSYETSNATLSTLGWGKAQTFLVSN